SGVFAYVVLAVSVTCRVVLFFFFSSRRRHTRLVSDWSSDVCSSDLLGELQRGRGHVLLEVGERGRARDGEHHRRAVEQPGQRHQIGRASCRERVEISVGGVSLKKKREGECGVGTRGGERDRTMSRDG